MRAAPRSAGVQRAPSPGAKNCGIAGSSRGAWVQRVRLGCLAGARCLGAGAGCSGCGPCAAGATSRACHWRTRVHPCAPAPVAPAHLTHPWHPGEPRREPREFLASQRPAQVRQRPARLEEHRLGCRARCAAGTCASRGRQQSVGRRAVEAVAGGGVRAFEAVEQPRLVALGLQPAQKPRAGVGERLVVEIDRILRRQRHARARTRAPASAASAAAASTAASRPAAGSPSSRRCRPARAASTCRAACASTTTTSLSSSETKNMRSRSSRCAIDSTVTRGLPAGGVEQRVDVERIAFEPDREVGRGEQPVEIRSRARSDRRPGRTLRARARRCAGSAATAPAR